MPNLKCHDHTCNFNYCTHCTKNTVVVGKEATCRSYLDKIDDDSKLAQYEFEFAMESGFSLQVDNHQVICNETRCRHNENGECEVNHLRVDKKENHAKCVTYCPRYPR